jgi:hypothetical protein
MYKKQNEKWAQDLLKASRYCYRKEGACKILRIVLALIMCLLGIFNRYFGFIQEIPFVANSDEPARLSLMLMSFLSGVTVVFTIFLQLWARNFNSSGTNCREMYDCFVYEIPTNKLLAREIKPIVVEDFAGKIKDKRGKLKNHCFATERETWADNVIFEKQVATLIKNYKLLMFARRFFYLMWVTFFFIVFLICVVFNDLFFNTAVYILIPSLSMVQLIIQGWSALNKQISDLRETVTTLGKMRKENRFDLSNKHTLRNIQDSIYLNRKGSFMIPGTIRIMFNKSKQDKKLLEVEQKNGNTTMKKSDW